MDATIQTDTHISGLLLLPKYKCKKWPLHKSFREPCRLNRPYTAWWIGPGFDVSVPKISTFRSNSWWSQVLIYLVLYSSLVHESRSKRAVKPKMCTSFSLFDLVTIFWKYFKSLFTRIMSALANLKVCLLCLMKIDPKGRTRGCGSTSTCTIIKNCVA